MNRRKEIINDYKRRKLAGGVYLVKNTQNGRYLLGHAANLQSIQNRFQFAQTTGIVFDPRLRKDWERAGAQAFTFEILEELEQKAEQSQEAFMEDLRTLEQLQRASFDETQAY
jgi:hypothetical protein